MKYLANRMEELENSFLTIFFEAANKIAECTESKLFFLMESSDGMRKIGGNRDLRYMYQVGGLMPQNTDMTMAMGEDGMTMQQNYSESHAIALADTYSESNDIAFASPTSGQKRKRKKDLAQEMQVCVPKKGKKTDDSKNLEESRMIRIIKEEGQRGEEEEEEGGDREEADFGIDDLDSVADTTSPWVDTEPDGGDVEEPEPEADVAMSKLLEGKILFYFHTASR